MATLNVLDISTAHVSEETRDWLQERRDPLTGEHRCPVTMSGEYGWLLYVPDHGNDDGDGRPFPADLAAVLDFARERDCSHVLLDADADTYADLPTYED